MTALVDEVTPDEVTLDGTSSLELLDALAPAVRAHRLGDGLVVRLSGVLDGQAVPELRRELLTPVPDGCADVLVDAGAVSSIDDAVLAVLVAGSSWAREAGCRFTLSTASPAMTTSIAELALGSVLPLLGDAG